jgi:hypothetical protein
MAECDSLDLHFSIRVYNQCFEILSVRSNSSYYLDAPYPCNASAKLVGFFYMIPHKRARGANITSLFRKRQRASKDGYYTAPCSLGTRWLLLVPGECGNPYLKREVPPLEAQGKASPDSHT